MPVCVARNHEPQSQARRFARQESQRSPALKTRPVIARFKNGVKVVKQPAGFKFAGCIKLLPTTFEIGPVPELRLGLERKSQRLLHAAITASGEAPISQATLRRMIRRWVSLFNETSSCPRALYTTLLYPETCVQSIGSPLSPTRALGDTSCTSACADTASLLYNSSKTVNVSRPATIGLSPTTCTVRFSGAG